MNFRKEEQGSVVLEAALVMPLYLVFVLALICVIRISLVQMALDHALSETTRQIAAHMYPVELLNEQFETSATGQKVTEVIDSLNKAREQVIEGEQFINDFAFLIPAHLLEVFALELKLREQIEHSVETTVNSTLNVVFKPIVGWYTDIGINKQKRIKMSELTIIKVVLPNLNDRQHAYFGIEAQVKVKLILPFVHKVVYIHNKSYERVWIGA